MQASLQPQHISIPFVHPFTIDPVTTYVRMCTAIPATPKGPFLILPDNTPLSIGKLRSEFKQLCISIGLNPEEYSIHSLRRGGAFYAHAQGADHKDVQQHGAWSSQCYWDYIAKYDSQMSTLCSVLAC